MAELPEDSRLMRELTRREIDSEERPWTENMMLMVAILNDIRQSNYLQEAAMWARADESKRGPAPEPPEMLTPPGASDKHTMEPEPLEFATRADWDALMALT